MISVSESSVAMICPLSTCVPDSTSSSARCPELVGIDSHRGVGAAGADRLQAVVDNGGRDRRCNDGGDLGAVAPSLPGAPGRRFLRWRRRAISPVDAPARQHLRSAGVEASPRGRGGDHHDKRKQDPFPNWTSALQKQQSSAGSRWKRMQRRQGLVAKTGHHSPDIIGLWQLSRNRAH